MDNSARDPLSVRFDAYAATIFAPPSDLLEAFECFTPDAKFVHMQRPRQGYAFGAVLQDQDGQLGDVQWGGQHPNPHVSFQGHYSHQAALLLRECFPGHAVARADPVLIDTCEPGAYDVLQDACIEVAKRQRIKVGTAGDHLVTMEGRSFYLGAPSAVVRSRLYDKAEERRAKLHDPAKLAQIPDHWARLEFQIRPKGAEGKRAAAFASPLELIGSAHWARGLAYDIAGLDVPRFDVSPAWRESDGDSAYWWMLKQFRRTLLQRLADAGSPECLGLQIVHDLWKL